MTHELGYVEKFEWMLFWGLILLYAYMLYFKMSLHVFEGVILTVSFKRRHHYPHSEEEGGH